MTWYNPWGTIRALRADIAEGYGLERSLRDNIAMLHECALRDRERLADAQALLHWQGVEIHRLEARLDGAILRDPETGRLLPTAPGRERGAHRAR